MANLLDSITGNVDYQGMYTALQQRSLGQLQTATQNALNSVNGQLTSGATQANNATSVTSNRSNLTAPISAALEAKNNAAAKDTSGTLDAGIQQNAANTGAKITTDLDNAGLTAMQQQAQGTQQMIGNIIGGIGSTAGALGGKAIMAAAL